MQIVIVVHVSSFKNKCLYVCTRSRINIFVCTWYRHVCTASHPHFTSHQARSALQCRLVSAQSRLCSFRAVSFLSSVSSTDLPPRVGRGAGEQGAQGAEKLLHGRGRWTQQKSWGHTSKKMIKVCIRAGGPMSLKPVSPNSSPQRSTTWSTLLYIRSNKKIIEEKKHQFSQSLCGSWLNICRLTYAGVVARGIMNDLCTAHGVACAAGDQC